MLPEGPSLKSKLDIAMEGMGPFTPLPEVASSLSLICLREILANIDGTIEGKDPEYLHDMRVASRRLRAAMRVFGKCYPKDISIAKDKARFVTALLGQVRDLDVRMIHLGNIKPLLSSRGRRTADLLIFNSAMQWELARERMIEGLNVLKGGSWPNWMGTTLSRPSAPNGKDWAPVIHSLPIITDNRTAVLAKSYLARIEGAVAAQHALRIAVKRYRYSIELLAFCLKKDGRRSLSICKTIQDDLGLMHDYDVLTEFITASRSRTLPKDIKKGLDEIKLTIINLRHQQFELFLEHLDPLIQMDPLADHK